MSVVAAVNFNPENKKAIDALLLRLPLVTEGKMFGYPAYYINKKMFACVYEQGVGIKIPAEAAKDLLDKTGISHFQPMGRAVMKEWIQITRENPEDYSKDIEIFKTAIKYADEISKK